MLFLIPEMDETLRVNGRGTITVDPDVVEVTTVDGRTPRVAPGIDVQECFIHCAKAFRRGGMWDPPSWLEAEARRSAAAILRNHVGIDAEPAVIAAELEAGYAVTMWEAGGRADA